MKTIESGKFGAWGLTALRVVVGLVFLVHGWQKLFVFGPSGLARFLEQAGFPFPLLSAVTVTAIELVGGAALLLGLFTRWSALLLAMVMLVATLSVHLNGGFFLPQGFEYTLTLLAANMALLLAGPGAAALDARFTRGRS